MRRDSRKGPSMALWFVPIFARPPSNSDDDPQRQKRALVAVLVGLVIMMLLGVSMLMISAGGTTTFPLIAVSVGVILVLLMGVMLGARFFSQASNRAAKRKRGLDGLDMYSLIDRLVDDLDEDEMAYLRHRLDDRESSSPDELPEVIDDLLSQRTEDRHAGRR
jgi:flagellar basal body-associated protein FliL